MSIGPAAGQLGNWQSVGGLAIIQTFDSATELDADKVRLQQLIAEGVAVHLGNGHDNAEMLAVTAARTLHLDAGAGNDTVKMTEVEALDKLFALMGEGTDFLETTYVRARNAMTLDGGAGYDTLNRYQTTYVPNLTIKNWEMINGRRVLTPVLTGGVLTASKA